MSDAPLETKRGPRTSISFFGALASSFLSIIALIGLVMMLAGYGIALAVEAEFGIPHTAIFKSSFDLLTLSVWFITWVLKNSTEALTTIFFIPSYWKTAAWMAVFGMLGCVIGVTLFLLRESTSQRQWLKQFPSLRSRKKLTAACLVTLFCGFSSAMSVLAAIPLILWAGLTLSVIVGAIPAISLEAGKAHIEDYVIGPSRCMPIFGRNERLAANKEVRIGTKKEHAATCVRLMQDGKTVAVGRVVVSTTELIVLYDPTSGKVAGEPLAGRAIEAVLDL